MQAKNKILIVDDDQELLKTLTLWLGDEYDVVTASDALTALRLTEQEHPDLVILDVRLPVGNGIILIPRLKALSLGHPLPVVTLTGLQSPFIGQEARKYGAAAVLSKAYEIGLLPQTIRQLLQASRPQAARKAQAVTNGWN